jgi:hypothetical protein
MRVVGPAFAQVAARLWDVAPDGTQALVTHALYRPRIVGSAKDVFQLHPNAWRFRAGHVAKLELLGQSSPYGRASSGDFAVTVTNLELRLPVLESPGGSISAPAREVFPPAEGSGQVRSCRLPSVAGRTPVPGVRSFFGSADAERDRRREIAVRACTRSVTSGRAPESSARSSRGGANPDGPRRVKRMPAASGPRRPPAARLEDADV